MPKKREAVGHRPVGAIIHADKRTNLPTADAQDFVSPEIDAPKSLLYPRYQELDPQLVWRGKDDLDRKDLEVQAPPIYIQEKIDPRVLIENVRKTAEGDSSEPELLLFNNFDGLGAFELVEFYQHSANWSNRMILGDSLNVMASLSEREALRGKVQMIYIDPPYGVKFGSNWQPSVRQRRVRDGNLEDAAREVEQIKAFRDTWEYGIHSYLAYLRDRLFVARDLLAASGSVFLQIGDENMHYVRSVLDEVFGRENHCADIVFAKTSGLGSELLSSTFDYLLWYARDRSSIKYRQLYFSKAQELGTASTYTWLDLPNGQRRGLSSAERRGESRPPSDARVYKPDNITSQGNPVVPFDYHGKTYRQAWKTNVEGLKRLALAGRLHVAANTLQYVRYLDDFAYSPFTNWWDDTATGNFTEDKIYVVQTGTKTIERCLLMTTDPGDLVIDPTCGSGTTAVVAEHWGRRWITIDSSRVALALARQRLMAATYPYYLLTDSEPGRRKEQALTGNLIAGPPPGDDVRLGFVSERVRHITLKSIAQNPDIQPGMQRDAIDEAIARNAEYELLFDRPYVDSMRIRVSGPFTVESLSPHRSLAFAPSSEPLAVRAAALDPAAPTFEETILANLGKAGIQNGRRNERLEFEVLEAYGGSYIQAVGLQHQAGGGHRSSVGVSIGPQYGTVGPAFIKAAAREAIKDTKIDLLCVLGFAFDPTALGATADYTATADGFANVAAERSLGRVPVLLVRMNADLVMGEDLKKTGAGNLFTVFGEPDIDIGHAGDQLTVEIKGVDVYDPTTGEVRSNDPHQIAMWMIDSNYNGESFFVRHCYFTSGLDPYKRLKNALKADINEEAWATLYRTVSRPFPRPETGKIAVKVINDYGDEVLKVFEV
jgi:adenine-specific DNA-methyltransferase